MMGFGFLFMLLLIAIPLFGFVALAYFFADPDRPGKWIRSFDQPRNAGRTVDQNTLETCDHCGSVLQQDWKHCPHCGADLK